MDYPLLSEIGAYDSLSEGFDIIRNTYNGLDEFLNREDYYNITFQFYKEFDIPKKCEMPWDELDFFNTESEMLNYVADNEELLFKACQDAKINLQLKLLELILLYDNKHLELNDKEYEILESLAKEKSQQLYVSDYGYEKYYSTFLSKIIAENNISEQTFINNQGTVISPYSICSDQNGDLYRLISTTTKGGKTVFVRYYLSVRSINKSECLADIAAYNNATFASSTDNVGYTGVNCASFAWLYDKSRYGNMRERYYLDTEEAERTFVCDPAYIKRNYATIGAVAVYNRHYAVVLNTSSSYNGEPLVISKWGCTGGVIIHPLSQCPYQLNCTTYYYK